MKIAEVVAIFPPDPGGTGFVCLNNARELARRGHTVTVFTINYGGGTPLDSFGGFDIQRLATPLISGGGAVVPQLYSKLRGFDIVHLHYPFFGGAEYVYLSSLVRKQKYFLTYHMDVPGTSLMNKCLVKTYEALFFRRILNRASRIGAVSFPHFERSKAARYIAAEKVVEIPNGVDTDLFSPRGKDRELVDRYHLEEKTVILFVGHLIPLKGLPVLLEAISLLKRADLALLVVGKGHAENEYRKTVLDRGLEKTVFFAGHQPQRELPRYYNTCDLLVLPSVRVESFGMVVLEAMASGKPAIVSSLPGPMQLVDDGVDGLVAAANDPRDLMKKIDALVREPLKKEAMGAAARQKMLARYSWDRIGDRLDKILREVAGH